jgi:hypothetical protein
VGRLDRNPGQVSADPTAVPFPVPAPPLLLPEVTAQPTSDPGAKLLEARRCFGEAEVGVPPVKVAPQIARDTPRVRCVSWRTACLHAFRALLLTRRRFGRRPVNVQPRNVRRHGRSTALLAALTVNFSRRVKNRVTLANTRCPARALFT